MSVDKLKRDIIDAAQKYKSRYKQLLNIDDLDTFKRLMSVYSHLDGIGGGGGGVSSIIAGSNISISPTNGLGDVTINASNVLTDPTGYGSFFSDQTQAISVIDTPQVVTFNNTYEANDVYISSNRIYFNKAGTYQFAYVAQVFNISNDIQHCSFWIKYNGNDFPDSATHITVNARKSASEPSEQQMKLILSGTAQNAGDYIELYWQGTSTDLSLGYVAAGPGEAPVDAPSVIANIIPIGAQGRDSNLNELNDVLITSPSTGQLLRYNTNRWENWTPNFLTTVPTLDQVTTAGNTTTNEITVKGITITNGTYPGKIINAGLNNYPNAIDLVMPTSGALRFGATSFDGPAFQGFHGTSSSYAGQMYFDYGSQQRSVSGRGAFFRNANSTSPVTVMKLTESSNVLIGTTTDAGFKLDVNGTIRSNNTITASGGNSTEWNTAYSWGDHSTQGYITGTTGFTGTFTVLTNPPGQQNLDIQNGLIVNVF